jgi:hypothetical protein
VGNGPPEPDAQHGPIDAGPAAKGGKDAGGDRRFQLRIAYIGAAATIIAAVIGAVIALHPWSSGPSGPSGLQLAIQSVSYPEVGGTQVIRVTGEVQNLASGEEVFVFAGRSAKVRPWYPGGPAEISSQGLWVIDIEGFPFSDGPPSVWAGVATPPPSVPPCPSGEACGAAAGNATISLQLMDEGPRSPALSKVTPAFHATSPGS